MARNYKSAEQRWIIQGTRASLTLGGRWETVKCLICTKYLKKNMSRNKPDIQKPLTQSRAVERH